MSDVIQDPIIADELPPIPVPPHDVPGAPVEPEKDTVIRLHFHFDMNRLTALIQSGELMAGETLLLLGEFSERDLADAFTLLAKFLYEDDHYVPFAEAHRQVKRHLPLNQTAPLIRELGTKLAGQAVPPENGRG
jgi:hypothetical protein